MRGRTAARLCVLAGFLGCAGLSSSATIGTSSWLQVNLSFMPFSYYDMLRVERVRLPIQNAALSDHALCLLNTGDFRAAGALIGGCRAMKRVLLCIVGCAVAGWSQKPVIAPGGVVNAASYAAGIGYLIGPYPQTGGGPALAGGSIASIFGSNLAASTETARTLPLPVQLQVPPSAWGVRHGGGK